MRTGFHLFAVIFWISFSAGRGFADVRIDTIGQWGGTTYAVAMRDNLAFVGVGPRVVVLDLTDPSAPRRIGQTVPLSFLVSNIALAGDRAFVGNAYGGFSIVDIAEPANPVLLGQAEVTDGTSRSQVRGLAVNGDLVFLACHETGLHVYDISNPARPREIGHAVVDEPCLAVVVEGNLAYVSSWYGFSVFDVSDPTDPEQMGVLPLVPNGFVVAGHLAFLADYVYGLAVVDVADPRNPTLIGVASEPGRLAMNVAVDGTFEMCIRDRFRTDSRSLASTICMA